MVRDVEFDLMHMISNCTTLNDAQSQACPAKSAQGKSPQIRHSRPDNRKQFWEGWKDEFQALSFLVIQYTSTGPIR